MTDPVALAVTLVVLVAVNVWVHLGPRRVQVVTGPAAALLLLAVARASGLTWAELGLAPSAALTGLAYGAAAAGLVALVYAVGVAVPATRGAFKDSRFRDGAGAAGRHALVTVPLATVLFEEVAFRGVLWGLLAADHGTTWALLGTSVLFGVWHVTPGLDLAESHTALGGGSGTVRRSRWRVVAGAVAFTTVAGLALGLLRDLSGSLVAPAVLHWATNGLGVLAAGFAWDLSKDPQAPSTRRAPPAPSREP